MNGPGAVFVLEIEGAGHALPSRIRLETGKRLEPISFGTRAQWVLVGAGVNDIHGYLAFDGAQLYVQSANPMYALRVEGAPVPAGWQAIVPPARIQVGLLTLTYVAEGALEEATQAIPETHRLPTPGDQDVTRYQPIDLPEPVRDEMVTRVDVSMFETSADDATRPGVPFEDSQYDQTRVNYDSPLHAGQAPQDLAPATVPIPFAPTPPGGHVRHSTDPAPPLFPSNYVAPRPAAGMPALGTTLALPGSPQAPPNPVDLARTRPGGAPTGILDLPPPPAPAPPKKPSPREVARELLTKLKAQWKEVSLPKKLVVVLMPFCFVAVAVLFGDKSPPQHAAATPPASPSAPATPATTTSAPGAMPPSSAVAPSPTQQTAPSHATAQAQPPAAPAAPSAPPAPAPSPTPLPQSIGGKTPERLAVDAVAAGAYAEAATRYESLAREHPDQPVYREAARILRSRADAGTP